MMKQQCDVKGMSCATCSGHVDKAKRSLSKIVELVEDTFSKALIA